MFSAIAGGFNVVGDDLVLLNAQRAITKAINDRFIQVGAVYLKTSSKNPFDENWFKSGMGDVNLQSWIDDDVHRVYNVGFNLQMGWMDIDIDADDPEFNRCVVSAMDYLGIDTRFKFGRYSVGCATHVLVQLGEDESANFDELQKFEPKQFVLNGKRYHVQLRSFPTRVTEKNLARSAKQTVVPGSIYTHKKASNQYDISVWYTSKGVADNVTDITSTTPRRVNFSEVVRAISFGVFLYCIKDHWVEGSRQATAQKITGWLARVVKDGAAMNNHEDISNDVFCPIDCDEVAEKLLCFVCDQMGDDESRMRIRTYYDASTKLERNPDARIPGWPAIEQLLGGEATLALRAVFTPGSDVSQLTKMAERYVYDETDNRYIDRVRFFTQGNFVHEGCELERRHKGDTIRINSKPKEAFKVFESSDMRKRVGMRDLHPQLSPGGLYRISSIGEVLSDEDDDDSALTVFNTWRGWPIKPAAIVNDELMNDCVTTLDTVLGYLTRDNKAQVEWIKKWLAWTFQNPGDKQQIAWVVVGGQGVGKSFIGNIFTKSLMGGLWGSASPNVIENKFNIGPFKDRMFVFIDEAKFHGEVGTDEIKKLIRSVEVPGMEKFEEARTYHIYSRIMFASNRFDMNIGQSNVRDRALFYTRAYDKDHMGTSELEFRRWTDTLKPFFERFAEMLKRRDVREHFVHLFMNLPTNKHEVESIRLSSSSDPTIVMSNMSWPRRIAKYIIEDGRIHDDLDITFPFTIADFNRRVVEASKEMGMQNVPGARVFAEFEEAGLIARVDIAGKRMFRFTHRLGSLHDMFGEFTATTMEPRYVFADDDYGENDCDGSKRPKWKGAKTGIVESSKF